MTTSLTFAAAVERYKEKTEEQLTALVRQSAQTVIKEAQKTIAAGGRMPVDTGFLRNSLVVMVDGARAGEGAESYQMALGTAEAGSFIEAVWTAKYAAAVEYGHAAPHDAGGAFIVRPRFFARGAAEQWRAIVEDVARQIWGSS